MYIYYSVIYMSHYVFKKHVKGNLVIGDMVRGRNICGDLFEPIKAIISRENDHHYLVDIVEEDE